MMTLDEAIAHAEEKAEELKRDSQKHNIWVAEQCIKCAEEHEQLAEWLKELKALKENKGDLISREALKEQFSNNCSHNCYYCELATWGKNRAYHKCGLIDNAPTVCGNNPKWCESCVSKGKCASTNPSEEGRKLGEGFGKNFERGLKDGMKGGA